MESMRTSIIKSCAAAICPKCEVGEVPEYQGDPTPMYWHGAEECEASKIFLKFFTYIFKK